MDKLHGAFYFFFILRRKKSETPCIGISSKCHHIPACHELRMNALGHNNGHFLGNLPAGKPVHGSILSACVTAFAGPISFVGIAVPHLMKRLFGTAEPMVLIPACFLGGSAFCLGCDLIARTAFAPTEMSISSVTAVFGAPVVIYMMLRRKGAEA